MYRVLHNGLLQIDEDDGKEYFVTYLDEFVESMPELAMIDVGLILQTQRNIRLAMEDEGDDPTSPICSSL